MNMWASSLLLLLAPIVLSKPALPKSDHDSLNIALQAVARQKRALMLEYGQPEDIGYGYQKAARSLRAALIHQQQQQQQQHQKHTREVPILWDDLIPQRRSAPTMFRERLRGVDKRLSESEEQRELADYLATLERMKAHNVIEPMGMHKMWEHHHRPEMWSSSAAAEADRERFLQLLNELHRKAQEAEEEREENGIADNDDGEGGVWPMAARKKKETPWFLPEEDDAVAMAAASAPEEDGDDGDVDDVAGRPTPIEWTDETEQFNLPKRIAKRGNSNAGPTRRLIFKTNTAPLEVRRKHKNKGDADPTDSTVTEELDTIFEKDKKDKNKEKKEKLNKDKRKAKSNATNKSVAVPPTVAAKHYKPTSPPAEPVKKSPKMAKKSVDWSEYFGIDKRSVEPDEWLQDEYIKMMAMATNVRKRSAGPMAIPSTHDHGNSLPPPPVLQGMANQLDSMADNAIGEALKYTGAHQGTTRQDQLAEVKAEVTARLLAAYRLEALRHSLEELRKTLENRGSHYIQNAGHYIQNDDPIDLQEGPEVVFGNNHMPSGTRSLLMDNPEDNRVHETGSCLALRQMASDCEAASHLAGEHAPRLMEACTRRQLCSVCGVSLGVVSPSTCEAAYFQSAQVICGDDPECRDRARRLGQGLKGLQVHSFRREMVTECADDPCVLQIFRQ